MTKEPMTISRKLSATTSLKSWWYTQPNLLIFLFVFTTFSLNSVSFSAAAVGVSYADHCALIVPESIPKRYSGYDNPRPHRGYYTGGGSGILSQDSSNQVRNSIILGTWNVRETYVQGLFKLQANLRFRNGSTYYYVGNSTRSLPRYPGAFNSYNRSRSVPHPQGSMEFILDGFWSESSGKLCMVGFGYSKYRDPLQNLHVVLKLNNLMNSTSVTSLISGTLERLSGNDPNNFEPVSILLFPSMNYQFTLVSTNSDNNCSCGSDDLPSSLPIKRFCSVITRQVLNHEFDLKYSSHCTSAKNCTPFAVSDLPHAVLLTGLDCSERKQRLRFMVEFVDSNSSKVWYRRPFNPKTTLIGEGSWDAKRNQLCVVACQLLDAKSLNTTHVGDCSTRLSLRYPAIWTIGNTSNIVGHIWSNKTVKDSGYFEKITFGSPQNDVGRVLIPGMKYEYTKIDKVYKLCPRKKTASANDKTNTYPNPFSYDMRFDMSAKNSEGEVAWGSSVPLSVGNQFYQPYWYSLEEANVIASTEEYSGAPVSSPVSNSNNHFSPYNISYKISIQLLSYSKLGNTSVSNEMQISAEGIYDDTQGSLCMVGCRNLGSNSLQLTGDSVDCDILVNFQFTPTNSTKNPGYVKGRIESTRKKSDPLYFDGMDLSSAASGMVEIDRSIWRMDVEITLVLISTTLACVFVALQLFHVKKHSDVLPTISIFMLLILTVGYMIPLMLNFEAMFTHNTNRQNLFLGSGGWLEVNEVIVRVITMVAFLLQFRLLQLAWSARSANGTQKELWVMEKNSIFVALPVYAAGALAVLLLMNSRKSDNDVVVVSGYQEHPILGALKSYAGLVLDGFLLPQILLNLLSKAKENALSVSFYIGTTFVRLVPHAYDLYRAHSSAHQQLHESYIYASPVADFYSTAWDVIIPFGGLLFAVIIYLQQKFGGRCILPQKLIELGSYEKVPTVSET